MMTKVLFKLCNSLKADYELTLREKELSPLLINSFSVEHHNVFVQQQKQYHKMTLNNLVKYFHICHSTDKPICKQCKCEVAEKSK